MGASLLCWFVVFVLGWFFSGWLAARMFIFDYRDDNIEFEWIYPIFLFCFGFLGYILSMVCSDNRRRAHGIKVRPKSDKESTVLLAFFCVNEKPVKEDRLKGLKDEIERLEREVGIKV